MSDIPATGTLVTHEVSNQPPFPERCDLWLQDAALRDWVAVSGGRATPLAEFGAQLGAPELRAAGVAANRNLPELVRFDRNGRRLDEVRFHPAYHDLMAAGLGAGYAAIAWDGKPGGHATHAAMVYLQSQVEPGVCCPMTMTYAGYPALAAAPDLAALWQPRLAACAYDPAVRPVGQKQAATLGMAMTEKQGGSDLRSNSTRAVADGDGYRLTGHKWFCSAPMSDGFLTLAQAKGGLTCFLVPRWLPDGTRNAIHLMRMKDKMGNRANASCEIEYHAAWAECLGEEGAGVRTILTMVHHTRLDTAMAPAGLMRAALAEAKHWCEGRVAFQRKLIDQPLMRRVLADLVLDWEGALALGLRVAAAYDAPSQRGFARIAVALAKFLSNKCCVRVIYEAMECLGGMGYVEDTPMPLLYREAPLNSIWEGSGNVICLDILRALARDPEAAEALRQALEAARGADARYDAALAAHYQRWPGLPEEGDARWFAERLAVLLTAAVLIGQGQNAVADAYVATRVAEARGAVAGAVSGVDCTALLQRI